LEEKGELDTGTLARRWWTGKPILCGSALLAGISGLGLEILLVTLCGLALGYGRSGPVGITTFIVGWALGARWSGTLRAAPGRVLLITGSALLCTAALSPWLLLRVGASSPGSATALCVSLLVLLAVAVPQGIFLPQLARGWSLSSRGDLGLLFAANLVGAAIGALLVGYHLPALFGRPVAAGVAGGLALLAGGLGALGIRGIVSRAGVDPAPRVDEEHLAPYHSGAILAACIGWLGTLEWIGLRLGVLWLGGMQEALTGVLLASMIALSIGAWLGPRLLGRSLESLVRLLVLCALSSLAFLFLPLLLGGSAAELPLTARALLLVGPALLPFGALVPILHRHTAGRGAERLGRLLLFEAAGVVVGLPISHLLLVPALGVGGTLVFWLLAPAASITLLVPRLRLRAAWGLAVVGALATAGGFAGKQPALDSPPLGNPALELLDFAEDQHFAVSVVRDGLVGESTLMTDGFRAAGTGLDYRYMRVLGHLPLLLHEEPAAVAVLAFGTGTTAGAVSLHEEVDAIDVLELSRAVTTRARWFEDVNLGVLGDRERVAVRLGDGRRTLGERPGGYDVVTMEPLLPDSPFGVYLYTEEFYERARASLAPGGLLCQWVPPHALEPETFQAVVAAFCSALPWSGVWLFGTQVILVGGEERPLVRASRFPDDGGLLHRALAELGLESPEGLLARYVSGGHAWPAATRPLTDGDPWIVYRPRRAGVVLLTDLPLNLAALRGVSEPIPPEWWVGLGEGAPERFEALVRLRDAREAFGVEEVEARGLSMPDPSLRRDGRARLAEAARRAPTDPEVVALERERRFLEDLREGALLLLRDPSKEGARGAALRLEGALITRPERGDVTLYLGIALRRLGDPRAGELLERALELCPRIAATPAGQRAVHQLALPPELLEPE